MKELPGHSEPEPKPLHNRENVGNHVRDLQEQANFRGESQSLQPNPPQFDKPAELGQQPLGASPEAYVVFPGELASPRSPLENPVQEQGKPQSGEEEEAEQFDLDFSPEDFQPAIFRCNVLRILHSKS